MITYTKVKYDPHILDKLQEELRKFVLESSHFEQGKPEDDQMVIWEDGDLKYRLDQSSSMKPMNFDLESAIKYHARQNYSLRNEPLARACMLDKGPQTIFDITAGTGKDLILLSHFGAGLTAFERHPLVFLLLAHAILKHEIQLKLHFYDAINIQRFCEEKSFFPDIVYFDPMYPEKKKSALPRKEMQIFKSLDLIDSDEDLVLKEALKVAKKRVVLKRPIKSEKLLKPTASIVGSTTRYDIYHIG